MEKLTATNYVDLAESAVKKLECDRQGRVKLTTSQIRNLLDLVNRLYDDARTSNKEEQLSERLQEQVQYVRLRFVYAAGRESTVKDFVEKSEVINYLKWIGGEKERLLLFCRYMEALVAYHKFLGGRD